MISVESSPLHWRHLATNNGPCNMTCKRIVHTATQSARRSNGMQRRNWHVKGSSLSLRRALHRINVMSHASDLYLWRRVKVSNEAKIWQKGKLRRKKRKKFRDAKPWSPLQAISMSGVRISNIGGDNEENGNTLRFSYFLVPFRQVHPILYLPKTNFTPNSYSLV